MATTSNLAVEVELKSPANTVWSAIKNLLFLLPKLLPEDFKSIDILEGDGRSAGTVYLEYLAQGSNAEEECNKSKIVSVDEKNKTIHYSLLEGGVLEVCKYFNETVVVKAKDEGSAVIWMCKYDNPIVGESYLARMRSIIHKIYQTLDAYLLGEKSEN